MIRLKKSHGWETIKCSCLLQLSCLMALRHVNYGCDIIVTGFVRRDISLTKNEMQ